MPGKSTSPHPGPVRGFDAAVDFPRALCSIEPVKLIDISPVLSDQTAVFPGDRAFEREVSMDFKKGDSLLLSSIRATLHLGAHADAPNHYHAGGAGIEERDLRRYLGKAQVIRAKAGANGRLGLDAIEGKTIEATRVLFATGSYPDPDKWNGDFAALSPELIDELAKGGVRLVGIDTPSVDPSEDKELPSHQALYRNDMAVLEGLVLDEVEEGTYLLIALPLRIKGADASPVRAVLVSGSLENERPEN